MRTSFSLLVTHALTRLGWTARNGTALASKTFDTAVGQKEAHAYLADYGPSTENYLLQGDYQSEGRNVLESHGVLLSKNASDHVLAQVVMQFAKNCDSAVAQSYAARLHARA